MKIHVNQVSREGLRQEESYDPTVLDMARADIAVREPFSVEAMITKAGRELIVNVDIACSLHLTCARCLEEYSATLTPRGILSYSVSPTEVVDITDDVRQEIILAYPMMPICRPDCKGLCVTCGQNLNSGTCDHPADPRQPDGSAGGNRINV